MTIILNNRGTPFTLLKAAEEKARLLGEELGERYLVISHLSGFAVVHHASVKHAHTEPVPDVLVLPGGPTFSRPALVRVSKRTPTPLPLDSNLERLNEPILKAAGT